MSIYSGPDNSPGFLLWRTSMRWRRSIEKCLKPFNLTHPQFVILASVAWLNRENKVVSQAMIARHAEIDPNTASQIIQGLESKGLIGRKQGTDARAKTPELTKAGYTLLKKTLPAVEKADEKFFESLDLAIVPVFQALHKLAGFEYS